MMSEDLNFSKLMEDDLEEVAKLYDEERTTITNRVKMKETFEKIKDKPEYKMIVVKNNHNIIGFAKAIIHYDIFEENNPFITIWSVRVKKEYRRLKVGSKLFEYIEKIAKDKNCEFICLMADKNNTVANQFYKSLGYECESGYVKFLRGLN